MSNLGTLKIYVCENHDGEMVFTSKEINNKNNKSERIIELEKFWDNYDNMSDKEKIDKLKNLLLWYQTDYVDLGIKNMQLKDEIRELKDKINNRDEKDERDNMAQALAWLVWTDLSKQEIADEIGVDRVTLSRWYDKIVHNVKYGEELI